MVLGGIINIFLTEHHLQLDNYYNTEFIPEYPVEVVVSDDALPLRLEVLVAALSEGAVTAPVTVVVEEAEQPRPETRAGTLLRAGLWGNCLQRVPTLLVREERSIHQGSIPAHTCRLLLVTNKQTYKYMDTLNKITYC